MANTFPNSGKVGIGTTGPEANLDVRGTGDAVILISDVTHDNRLLIGTDDQLPSFLRLRPQAGAGVAITNDGDKIGLFVRASDGNVGVGTSDPQSKLHIDGSVTVSGQILNSNLNSVLASLQSQLRFLEQRVSALERKV